MCNAITVWILYHPEQFRAFILVKIACCWLPLWSALRQKCSHLFGSPLSSPQACWKVWSLLSCIHTAFPFLSYSASPACVCVNGTLLCFVVGPLQAQLCLTRVLLLSIDIDRTSLCVSECVPLKCIFIFLFIHPLSVHIPICECLFFPFSPPFHLTTLLHFPSSYFVTSGCRNLPVCFSVLGGQTTCGEVNTLASLYCLQLTLCNITDLFTSIPYPALKSLFSSGIWDANISVQFVMQSCFFSK